MIDIHGFDIERMRPSVDSRLCRTLSALGLGGALAFGGPMARANGRYPAANQLTIAPSDPQSLLLRTTFGFLVSRDGGVSWDWICEQAVGYAGMQDPAIGVTATGNVLAGAFEGLSLSPDGVCSWGLVDRNPVVDLVVRAGAPHEALVVTSAFSGTRDGGNVFLSRVLATNDDGAHWAGLGSPLDPALVLVTIEVAQADPQRIYLSGHRSTGSGGEGLLLVSSDGGATFTERPIPLDAATESDAYIAAVDPRNADLVYLRTGGANTSRLLVTADAGKTYAVRFVGGAMLGFALSPDGSKVYLGGSNDGLQVASKADYVFRRTSTVPVQCLRANGALLYVCSDELSGGFTLGESTDDGSTIAPRLHLTNVRGPGACPPSSSAAVCVANWPTLQQQLGIGMATPDAGGPPVPDGGDSRGGSTSGCRCDAAGVQGPGLADPALLVMTWLLAFRLLARRRV
jgi:photosystem II stability/assembly factor-like uncharacterized protein